jgi:hypothetical protein
MPAQHRGAIAGLATTTKGLGLPSAARRRNHDRRDEALPLEHRRVRGALARLVVPVLAAIPLVASLIPCRERG